MKPKQSVLNSVYYTQWAQMLRALDQVFVEAIDCEDTQGLARAIEQLNALTQMFQSFIDEKEQSCAYELIQRLNDDLCFFLERSDSLLLKDRAVFISLYEYTCEFFESLAVNDSHTQDHSQIFLTIEQAKKSLLKLKDSLSFNTGASNHSAGELREEALKSSVEKKSSLGLENIRKLQRYALELDQYQRSLEVESSHLGAISTGILELSRKANLASVSSLYEALRKKWKDRGAIGGLHCYGGEHRADAQVLCTLERALLDMAGIDTKLPEERFDLVISAYMEKDLFFDIRISPVNPIKDLAIIKDEELGAFSKALNSQGFSVNFKSDCYSGCFIQVQAPHSLGSLQGQIVKVAGEFFCLDLREIKAVVDIESDDSNSNANANEKTYQEKFFDYNGELIPLVSIGACLANQSDEGYGSHRSKKALILSWEQGLAAVLIEELCHRQELALRALNNKLSENPFFKAVCFLDSGRPSLLLDTQEILKSALMDTEKGASRLRKFARIGSFAIEAQDIVEIMPYSQSLNESCSSVPGAHLSLSMANFKGEAIMVYALDELIRERIDSEHPISEAKAIIICQEKGEYFGLAVGEGIAIKAKYDQDCFNTQGGASELIRGAFLDQGQECAILDMDLLAKSCESLVTLDPSFKKAS